MKKMLLFCTVFLITFSTCISQDKPVRLIAGQTLQTQLSPHELDTFLVSMKAGEFASVRITEKHIRLHARVYDPAGKLIHWVDQNRMGDKEVVTIFSTIPGSYRVIVGWNFEPPLTGDYTITLQSVEKAGKDAVQKARQLFEGWYLPDAPGAALLVIKNGKPVLKICRGMADLETGIPVQSNSLFEMASCSKQFTGYAVAMLADQQRLGLQENIRKYFPEMPVYSNPITIAQLTNHTSGIRNIDDLQYAGFSHLDRTTLPICLNFAYAQKKLLFTPGDRFEYSNTNYNLLAELVSRVTNTSFAEWCRANIFRPVGMDHTLFKAEVGQVIPRAVKSYQGTENGYREQMNNWGAVGASCVMSSLDDLEKWLLHLESKKSMSPGLAGLLSTPTKLNNGRLNNYVFGNTINTQMNGQTEIMHLGLVLGYRTALYRYPEEGLCIAFMANDGNDASFQRISRIIDLFRGTNTEELPDLTMIPNIDALLKEIEAEKTFKESIDLSPYTGVYYANELSTVWEITNHQGRLLIKNQRMDPLHPKYAGKDLFDNIQFQRNEAGKIVGLEILGSEIVFERKVGEE